MTKKKEKRGIFERFSNAATQATGSSGAFIAAVSVIVVWALTGPIFNYSDVWQLMINTGTTIITFLMVFLIQKSQNKDSKAIHLKLNEVIAAQQGASNRMVDLEDLSEEELDQLHKFYAKLAQLAKKDNDILCSHSIDAAEEINTEKEAKFSPIRKRKSKPAHTAKKP
ncbi:low affinity iron permease family protein [Hufsiella ginkgonis]|uniref:Low affinity iron permease family protein n=1 Tax=Hufsiella ginkgonis TaxID=2695274 RepID=A0A7K1XYP0_9SPHI|nr:low affinity iron permease family protein [Hufsiella ginkgonis]MXV15859.1 low affinity iron permease family protein [Hufsiella ginkgonis]